MTKRTLGILATIAGSALGAWWITMQRREMRTAELQPASDRGTVIFDNTPTAADTDLEGIV